MRTTRANVTIDKYGATICLPKRQHDLLRKYLGVAKNEVNDSFSIFHNDIELQFIPLPPKKSVKNEVTAGEDLKVGDLVVERGGRAYNAKTNPVGVVVTSTDTYVSVVKE